MRKKRIKFIQNLFHEIENEDEIEDYIEYALPLIGRIVMEFNALEQFLDLFICQIFSDRSEDRGLIVINKMTYSNKVDLLKRLSDDMHNCFENIDDDLIKLYEILITNLKEAGRLRNLVVHADWENTNEEKYTYVNLKISKNGKFQEYIQFSKKSLNEIIELMYFTKKNISDYWQERDVLIYG
jgi:hypothetical protein